VSGAARAALRRVLQHHKVTVHGDGVLEADIEAALGVDETAQPVCSINKAHLKQQDGPWCKEALLYSPDNQGDSPGSRVMLYTAGRLDDALEWAEKGLAEWRAAALAAQAESRRLGAENRIAVGHLQAVLNKARTHAEQQAADTAARDWLTSIGSEPT
jgi:hypothetical protein